MGRLRFAFASLAIAACGLDLVGTKPETTPSVEAGAAADVSVPDGSEIDTSIADAEAPDADVVVDATPDNDVAIVDAGPPIRVATVVASGISDLRSVAVTPDGGDLYVAADAGRILHYTLSGNPTLPATAEEVGGEVDIRALTWAADLNVLAFVTGSKIGQYTPNPANGFSSNTHSNEHVGVDIAYANHRIAATYTDKVTTYSVNPTTGAVGEDIQESATGSGNGTPAGVAYDSNFVYWADTTNNFVGKSSATQGGVSTPFVSGLAQPTSVAVNGNVLYIAQSTSIVAADITGTGTSKPVVSGLSTPFSLTYTTSVGVPVLLWLEVNGEIKLLPVGGSTPLLVGSGSPLRVQDLVHQHLMANGTTQLFWGNPVDGTIRRVDR